MRFVSKVQAGIKVYWLLLGRWECRSFSKEVVLRDLTQGSERKKMKRSVLGGYGGHIFSEDLVSGVLPQGLEGHFLRFLMERQFEKIHGEIDGLIWIWALWCREIRSE